MTELHDYCFSVNIGCGQDSWSLGGRVFGHPNYPDGHFIYVSTPEDYDSTSKIMTGFSGRKYLLVNPRGDIDEIENEIRKCINNGGYETW